MNSRKTAGIRMLMRAIAQLMTAALIVSGCATKQVGIDEQHAVTRTREVIVKQVEYSRRGLPLFLNQLGDRPYKEGDRFAIAQLVNNRPITSFDIAVIGPKADFTKPFKVVYEWTGKGFQGGATGTMVGLKVVPRATTANNRDEAVVMFAVILAPLVVGTAGGFIIGLADGIKTTAEEVGKVVLGNHEQVVTYTTYAYDTSDRLCLMRMYTAAESRQELVRTEYTYDGASVEPVKTRITRYPDGAVMTLE